jgi:hypothetical protein
MSNYSGTLSFCHSTERIRFAKVLEKISALKQNKVVGILVKSVIYTAHLIFTSKWL